MYGYDLRMRGWMPIRRQEKTREEAIALCGEQALAAAEDQADIYKDRQGYAPLKDNPDAGGIVVIRYNQE